MMLHSLKITLRCLIASCFMLLPFIAYQSIPRSSLQLIVDRAEDSENIITSGLTDFRYTKTEPVLNRPDVPKTEPVSRCSEEPKQNIMFLKTHKTGSSTLQNILVRYAYNNDRIVGLPKGDILFGYYSGTPFTKSMLMSVPGSREVNMLMHHMVFNHQEVASVLPSDSVYITILRDPATQFESVFHYLRKDVRAFSRAVGENGLRDFVTEPQKYFKGSADGRFWWFGKNGMFFDLGFDNLSDDEKYINESIAKTNKIFDLVLISEYFDLSMLLLRDLLCWEMKDIVYLSMNARVQSTVENVTDDVMELTYKWNRADAALYKHFNDTFWRRVDEYGKSRLENDLKEYNKLKEETSKFCVEDKLENNRNIKDKTFKMFNPEWIDVTQYKLKEQARNNNTCQGMIYPEIVWHKKLVDKQYKPVKRATGLLGMLAG